VAKTAASNRRPAPKKPPARKSPTRGGRPAGLFTWIAVGLVVVVVVALVIVKVATGGTTTPPGKTTFQPVSPAVFSELTTIPSSVFNTVGVTSPIAAVTPPQPIAKQPALTATGASGETLPEVLYMGAEYCPYCAAQRWATIIALSRFGTFSNLGNISSYSGDVYPNTPSFTFLKAKYTSKYLVFKSVEMYTNYIDPTTSYYAKLQTPTTNEEAELTKYDSSKYIAGLPAADDGSIPFITFANKFLVAGASYSPTTLAGSTRDSIAGALDNATSPITQAIISSANYQTAALCTMTGQQPGNVCTSAGVKTAAKAMGIK
jgi:thiol-disulfide isomerase/thioredoxin